MKINNNLIAISGKIGSGKDTVGAIIQYLICLDKDALADHQKDFNEFILAPVSNQIQSGFEIKKFADKLKGVTCLLLNCNRGQLEDQKFKNKELGEEWWYWILEVPHHAMSKTLVRTGGLFSSEEEAWKYTDEVVNYNKSICKVSLVKLTPRLLLQLLGTECGREIIHPNIWVNSLFSDYNPEYKGLIIADFQENTSVKTEWHESKWIITDMRFPNELKAVEDRGGITIRINRDYIREEQFEGKDGIKVFVDRKSIIDKIGEHPSETGLDEATFDYVIENNSSIEELIEKVKEILQKERIISYGNNETR